MEIYFCLINKKLEPQSNIETSQACKDNLEIQTSKLTDKSLKLKEALVKVAANGDVNKCEQILRMRGSDVILKHFLKNRYDNFLFYINYLYSKYLG